MSLRRVLTVAGTTLGTIVALAAPAAAHSPVLLDRSDVVPWVAPKAVDGSDEFAWYGVLPRKGAVRSFQLTMRAGDPLGARLAIPDQAPENTLATEDLPRVFVIGPDASIAVLEPTTREPATIEPDPGMDVLRLGEYSTTAVGGTYTFVVTGRAAARFVVATGSTEDFHGLLRGVVAPAGEVFDEWYYDAP